MKIVTVVSDEGHYGLLLLKLSCMVNNLELVVLVADEFFTSLRLKDDILKKYLRDKRNDDVILFTDGYDAIFMCSEEEILEKFYSTKKNLVFSTETNCWPDSSLANLYPEANTAYKYLNSGGFIGKVGSIKELMDDYSFDFNKFDKSNQYVWTQRLLRYPGKIALDTACEIFCTFSPEIGQEHLVHDPRPPSAYYNFKSKWFKKNFTIENNRIFNKITNTWPAQAHFNGPAKHILDSAIVTMIMKRMPRLKIETINFTG